MNESKSKLRKYYKKRDFDKTTEPKGKVKKAASGWTFTVQKHAARRLHYDFRLELDGVLKSWAVPKGPSLDPREKRLAVEVEDHPVEYGDFEGTIPQGQYGGGTVMLWDHGNWETEGNPRQDLAKGKLKFKLEGGKLHGSWTLVKMRTKDEDQKNWLLIKEEDNYALPLEKGDVLENLDKGILSGLTLQQIAKKNGAFWDSNGKSKKISTKTKFTHKTPSSLGGKLSNATHARQPERLIPQLATLSDQVPTDESWLHEIKFDGYRLLCHCEGGEVRLLTRTGEDWTSKFLVVADEMKKLNLGDGIFDGELVALDDKGISDFQALQNAIKNKNQENLRFYVFDLPYFDGYDLRQSPFFERKQLLAKVLSEDSSPIVLMCEHIVGDGKEAFELFCRSGLEGIVSKSKDGIYSSGRTRTWLKVKCGQRQEFVIGGFTAAQGSRIGFGALLLGVHRDGEFIYCGRVGTGFNDKVLKSISAQVEAIAKEKTPFANPPTGQEAKGVVWTKPSLVCEVEFTGWTKDGRLRHPSFKGMRLDKKAAEVVKEESVRLSPKGEGRKKKSTKTQSVKKNARTTVQLTNPDRVLYPDEGITKQDLANYYTEVATWVLPHLINRPLSLVRCPHGSEAECFFQKHFKESTPSELRTISIKEKSGEGEYIVLDDVDGLIRMVQLGVLEIHPWGSLASDIERPDRLVFDLDPAPDVAMKAVVEAAHTLKQHLSELDLESYVRTSGGKGLHVVVPVAPGIDWQQAKELAKAIAQFIEAEDPEKYISVATKNKRAGKIFIDYLRNGRGATSIASYSTRSRAGATVATPLTWEELDGLGGKLDPKKFNINTIPERLKKLKKDPWQGFFENKQRINEKLKKVFR